MHYGILRKHFRRSCHLGIILALTGIGFAVLDLTTGFYLARIVWVLLLILSLLFLTHIYTIEYADRAIYHSLHDTEGGKGS